jgi:KDO2-lipid IV(A) lauroyltransferase
MNEKDRSPFRDFVVYATIRTIALLLQLMPVSAALAIARFAAWLAYRLDKRHRLVALENLRHAFPQKSEAEIDALVRATYRHLFTMVVEYVILLRRMHPGNVQDYAYDADLDNRDLTFELSQSSRPTIFLTGHVGNWEVLSLSTALGGYDCSVVARRLDNPYLDRYVRRIRSAGRARIIDKDGASGEAETVLAVGGNLAVLGDQDAGPKGLFVDFFGRPASTFKSIALLALHQNAIILVVSCLRDGKPLRHVLSLEEAIDPQDYASKPDAVRAITHRYTAALERVVQRHPEQYFWLHRRWKHQPRARQRRAA